MKGWEWSIDLYKAEKLNKIINFAHFKANIAGVEPVWRDGATEAYVGQLF